MAAGSIMVKMDGDRRPAGKELVLVGGGHSHVTVLKGFGMRPLDGVRITLVGADLQTPYSGMLPGLVAGHYQFQDAHIDLERLARFGGIRFFHRQVTALDPIARTVTSPGHPPLPYHVLSINIGSTPSLDEVPGASETVIPVKPIGAFVTRWNELMERVVGVPRRLTIGVVGGGAGGVELALSTDHALRKSLERLGGRDRVPELHLFNAAPALLSTHNRGVRRRMTRILRGRGIQIHNDCRVIAVEDGHLKTQGGALFKMDEVLWVTQASAQAWPGAAGLSVDGRGFIRVADTLESISHPGVFAAGDCAAMVGHSLEKAGVFAVRQGPPLEANLRNALLGKPLKTYRPQRRFLSLISTGDAYAVASRGSWSLEGRWVWKWKDWIDRRFMARFNTLPDLPRSGACNGVVPGR